MYIQQIFNHFLFWWCRIRIHTLVSLIVDHMLIFFFVNFSLPICLIKDYAYITCDKFLTLCFYCDYYAYIEI